MPIPTGPIDHYRPCAGVALFNADGRVWLGRRIESHANAWQLPQGGIDAGEDAQMGAIRELEEETGIHVNLLSPLGEIQDWLYYDIPKGKGKHARKNWRGQKQKWYAFRYHGTDADINLRYHLPAEFSEYRWARLSEIADLIVPFKRKVYERLQVEFGDYAKAVK